MLEQVSRKMRTHVLPGILGGISLFCSLSVLVAGWLFGNEWLTRLVADAPTMKANTAVMLSIAAFGILLTTFASERVSCVPRVMASVFVFLIGSLYLTEILVGASFGFSQLVVSDPWTVHGRPGQMSAATAGCGMLIAIFLVTIKMTSRWIFVLRTGIVVILGLLILMIGHTYVFNFNNLNTSDVFGTMSILTLICVLFISSAIALVDGNGIVVRQLRSGMAGGIVMRGLFAPMLLIPIVVGYMIHEFVLERTVALAVLTATGSLVLFAIVLIISRVLDRQDVGRRNALQAAVALQEEAIQARHRAEEASEAKTRFLASFSHDLRTPLNAIIGMSELIK